MINGDYEQAMRLVRDQTAAIRELGKLLRDCQQQNERPIRTVEYYAGTDWKALSLVDRGEAARTILREVVK